MPVAAIGVEFDRSDFKLGPRRWRLCIAARGLQYQDRDGNLCDAMLHGTPQAGQAKAYPTTETEAIEADAAGSNGEIPIRPHPTS